MKKLLGTLFVLASLAASAQSFHKGALITDLTYGFDVYAVQYTTQLVVNGTVIATDKTTDAAASKSATLGVQYGLGKWFALGLRGKLDNYVTSADSITGIKPSASGFEVGAVADFHVLRREHFNLALGLDVGASHLTYKSNDPASNYLEIYGDGSWVNFHITPRYYFGRFGLCANINIPTINYPSMTTSNKTVNTYIFSSWKGTGFGMNFGVQYRFLNPRD